MTHSGHRPASAEASAGSDPGEPGPPGSPAHCGWGEATRGQAPEPLTVWVVQYGSGDGWLQLLQADLLTVPAAAPCLQGHLVDLFTTSVAKIMGDPG